MKLVAITIKNFRCFKDEKRIDIGDLTTIIGRNDIGKSSILEALEIFFNNEIVKIECDDCAVTSTEKTMEISCEFSDPPDKLVLDAQAETSLADEYLLMSNGNLQIKKIYDCSSTKIKEEVLVSAHHPTTSQFDDLMLLNNYSLKQRLKDLGIDETEVLLNSNPSIRRAIWGSCQELHFSNVLIPLTKEDGKKIWDRLNEHIPLFALFQSDRPSRDTDDEIQNPMKLAVTTALAEPEIKRKLQEISESVKNKACELAERTHLTLTKIDPGLAAQLSPEYKSSPKWSSLFNLTLKSDEGIPVNKRGSGIRRLILVSFFRAEAERRLEENLTNNIIYAIEEPETSQHPHNQRILLEAFQDLAEEPNCQVILTTHSTGLASLLPIESLRFIKKGSDNQPVIELGSEETWAEIANTLGVVPDNRVRVFVCVEGPTDQVALCCLSKALHKNNNDIPNLANDPRIAFILMGGGTLKHWVDNQYLKEFGRPEVHIYDSDVPTYAEKIRQVNARNDGSWGVLTKKLEIENYLHEDAIFEGISIKVSVCDDSDIPDLLGKKLSCTKNNIKKKLAKKSFPLMTASRLAERDPIGEVEGWFNKIGELCEINRRV